MSGEFEGYERDDEGRIEFMTVQCEFEINDFEDYMMMFKALVELSEKHENVMPIVVFGDGK